MHGYSLERALEGISKAGFRNIELGANDHCSHVSGETVTDSAIKQLQRGLADYGLQIVSLSSHVNLAGRTREDGFRQVRRLKSGIDLAKKLGCKYVITGPGEVETDEQTGRFFENIRATIDYCEREDIIIGLETHGKLTATAEACREVLSRLHSKHIGINYDTANVIYYGGVRPEEDVVKIADKVVHVHAKDHIGGKGEYDFPAIGDGDIDFRAVFSALRTVDYGGPYSVEVEFRGPCTVDGPEIVDEALGKSFRKLTEITKHGQ